MKHNIKPTNNDSVHKSEKGKEGLSTKRDHKPPTSLKMRVQSNIYIIYSLDLLTPNPLQSANFGTEGG